MTSAPAAEREPWARPDCRTCGGWGFIWALPRDGGDKIRCSCGNCQLAANPPAPSPVSGEVTKEDDKAAADLIRQYWQFDEKMQALADSIEFHQHPNLFSRAFKNHRLATAQAGEAERLREALTQAAADFDEHAAHAQTRIEDGTELGASVWRIALVDIKREAMDNAARARTALASGDVAKGEG